MQDTSCCGRGEPGGGRRSLGNVLGIMHNPHYLAMLTDAAE